MGKRKRHPKKPKYNRDHPRPQLGSGAWYGDLPRTIEDDVPPLVEMRDLPIKVKGTKVYSMGECTVHHRLDEENGHYLSVSHPSRYPTWDEVAEARYRLVPDRFVMAMIMPPMKHYLNIHPYMFNVHQIGEEEEE